MAGGAGDRRVYTGLGYGGWVVGRSPLKGVMGTAKRSPMHPFACLLQTTTATTIGAEL